MHFLPLGIGDFFSRIHYHTSLVVMAGGEMLLVDCPSPLRKMLYEASQFDFAAPDVDLDQIGHVILTHLHGDHANGLEELAFYKRFIQKQRPRLYTTAEVLEDLWEHRLRATLGFLSNACNTSRRPQTMADWFDVVELREGRTQTIGRMRLEIRPTRHFLPCFGFRISCGGQSLGFSADTVFDPGHIEFLSECDTIIHESGESEGHTFLRELMTLPEPLRRKMHIAHVPDAFDIAHSPIPVLEPGHFYEVAASPAKPGE